MKKYYNKLVRDKIPEIIELSGKAYVIEILSNEDYLKMLDEKLNEEVAEYQADNNIEELADILEVLYAIMHAHGYSIDELEKIRKEKADKRGAFAKRLFLKYVESKEE